jgi:hypothetical protein
MSSDKQLSASCRLFVMSVAACRPLTATAATGLCSARQRIQILFICRVKQRCGRAVMS